MLRIPKPRLRKLSPKVFLITFKLLYDLGMFFIHPQEFYESPKFRNRVLPFEEYMRWYSLEHGKGVFNYMKEYQGFNLPGHVIKKWMEVVRKDKAFKHSQYSQLCYNTMSEILKQNNNSWDFYLIGVAKKSESDVLRHEVGHGLFYTNKKYRKEMLDLVYSLEFPEYDHMIWALGDSGYGANFHDEFQAYMLAGLRKNMNKELLNPLRPAFKKIFKKYHKKRVPKPKEIA